MDCNSASTFIKALKLLLNLTICLLYSFGASGSFMGIQGPYKGDTKNTIIEISAGCAIIAFFIRDFLTLGTTICCETKNRKWIGWDALIDILGLVAYIGIGIPTFQYWKGQNTEDKDFIEHHTQGMALGSLCFVQAVLYFSDSVISTWLIIIISLRGRIGGSDTVTE